MTTKTYFALVHPNHANPDASPPRLYAKKAIAERELRKALKDLPNEPFRIVEVAIEMVA